MFNVTGVTLFYSSQYSITYEITFSYSVSHPEELRPFITRILRIFYVLYLGTKLRIQQTMVCKEVPCGDLRTTLFI